MTNLDNMSVNYGAAVEIAERYGYESIVGSNPIDPNLWNMAITRLGAGGFDRHYQNGQKVANRYLSGEFDTF